MNYVSQKNYSGKENDGANKLLWKLLFTRSMQTLFFHYQQNDADDCKMVEINKSK